MLVVEKLNNIQKSARETINMWNYKDVFIDDECSFFDRNQLTLKNFNYPYWNNIDKTMDIVLYKGLISVIENDSVTVEFDNQKEDQKEYYTFSKNFFDFPIKVNQIIELVAEKRKGEYSLKPRKYQKSDYYILKENNILNNLIDEDDDF